MKRGYGRFIGKKEAKKATAETAEIHAKEHASKSHDVILAGCYGAKTESVPNTPSWIYDIYYIAITQDRQMAWQEIL